MVFLFEHNFQYTFMKKNIDERQVVFKEKIILHILRI